MASGGGAGGGGGGGAPPIGSLCVGLAVDPDAVGVAKMGVLVGGAIETTCLGTGIETVAAIVETVISGTVASGTDVGSGELVAADFGVGILEVPVSETDGEELGVS